MLLAIDVGNTNIKFGLFDGSQMRTRWRVATDRERLADEYAVLLLNLFATEEIPRDAVTGCVLSSVVPGLTEVFTEVAQRRLHVEPLVVGPRVQTRMFVSTDYPAEVGADLITNALAAREVYGAPVIVIGFGTATTFTAVNAAGALEGVAIAPGVITGAESLFQRTAQLPQVALARPAQAIGKNTIHSIQAGLVFGFAGLVEGIVTRMKAELGGQAHVVATGGLAPLIAREAPSVEAVEPDLTLIGLRIIWEMNRPA